MMARLAGEKPRPKPKADAEGMARARIPLAGDYSGVVTVAAPGEIDL